MRRTPLVMLGLLLPASVLLALALGAVTVPLGDAWRALGGGGDPMVRAIVHDLRLPRVMLALLVGAALGMSGAALQATLRNALAEPYLLGVSGGAAVGARRLTRKPTFSCADWKERIPFCAVTPA